MAEPVAYRWRFVFPTHKGPWHAPTYNLSGAPALAASKAGADGSTFEVEYLYVGPPPDGVRGTSIDQGEKV